MFVINRLGMRGEFLRIRATNRCSWANTWRYFIIYFLISTPSITYTYKGYTNAVLFMCSAENVRYWLTCKTRLDIFYQSQAGFLFSIFFVSSQSCIKRPYTRA